MSGVGEALVDVLLQTFVEGRPRVRRVVEWIADVARPPTGVRLVANDGSEYTGFVLLEANQPKLMVALRVGVAGRSIPREPPYPRETQYLRPVFDEHLWRRDEDSYR